jgi:hypothetical protein
VAVLVHVVLVQAQAEQVQAAQPVAAPAARPVRT